MNFTFFTDFDRNINEMVISIVNTISNNALDYFLPVVASGLGVSILWFGTMVTLGNYDMPALDFVKKVAVICVVVGIAGAGGLYQTQLMQVVLDLPGELATALVDNSQQGTNVLDVAAEKTLQKTMDILDLVGVSPSSWLNALVGIVFFVSGLFLIGSTAVYFIISKVVVSILAGLGFIFIFTFLWEPVRNFFAAWVNQIIYYSLMLVVSSLFFSFLMGMYDKFITAFTVGDSNMIYSAFAIAIFTYIGYRLLNEIPHLCAAISNGVHIGSLMKAGSNTASSNAASSSSSGGSGSKDSSSGSSGSGIPSPISAGSAPFRGKSAA